MIVRIIRLPARYGLVPMSWRRNPRFFDVHIENRNSGVFSLSIDIIECTGWRIFAVDVAVELNYRELIVHEALVP